MSFFRKLFGIAGVAELEAEADKAFEAGQFGTAKLSYERALEKADGEPEATRDRLAARVVAARDAIAEQRITEANRLLDHGQIEHAEVEAHGALEVAASEDVRRRAEEVVHRLETFEAYAPDADPGELTDEDRTALVVGQWSEPQTAEYDAYGDDVIDAGVLMHKEHFVHARDIYERLLASAENPRWLYRDVGRARLAVGDTKGAEEALRAFLAEVGSEAPSSARLEAHVDLVRLSDERGDFEGATAELEAALESAEDDPQPFIVLGNYLRLRGHPKEAIEVLRVARRLMGETFDWYLVQETALCFLDLGDSETAEGLLDDVVAHFTNRGRTDLPVDSAKALARIYEDSGRLERAADMYRVLSQGSHRAGHAQYCVEAARLLERVGLPDEARRMLRRAVSLLEPGSEERATAERRLAALEAPAP